MSLCLGEIKLIYKITNSINNKLYIGKYTRKKFYETTFNKYWGSGTLIKKEIKKYGIKNFKKEIIEYCKTNEELNKKEKYWIKTLNCITPNGYNITIGGVGGDIISNNPNKKIILKKQSEFMLKHNPFKNKKHTKRTKEIMSRNHANVKGKNNPMYGKGYKLIGKKNGRAKHFIFYSPCGIKHNIIGEFQKFCKSQNIKWNTMYYQVLKGNKNNYKGWKVYEYKQ
jgi:group I intron endonuclease